MPPYLRRRHHRLGVGHPDCRETVSIIALCGWRQAPLLRGRPEFHRRPATSGQRVAKTDAVRFSEPLVVHAQCFNFCLKKMQFVRLLDRFLLSTWFLCLCALKYYSLSLVSVFKGSDSYSFPFILFLFTSNLFYCDRKEQSFKDKQKDKVLT